MLFISILISTIYSTSRHRRTTVREKQRPNSFFTLDNFPEHTQVVSFLSAVKWNGIFPHGKTIDLIGAWNKMMDLNFDHRIFKHFGPSHVLPAFIDEIGQILAHSQFDLDGGEFSKYEIHGKSYLRVIMLKFINSLLDTTRLKESLINWTPFAKSILLDHAEALTEFFSNHTLCDNIFDLKDAEWGNSDSWHDNISLIKFLQLVNNTSEEDQLDKLSTLTIKRYKQSGIKNFHDFFDQGVQNHPIAFLLIAPKLVCTDPMTEKCFSPKFTINDYIQQMNKIFFNYGDKFNVKHRIGNVIRRLLHSTKFSRFNLTDDDINLIEKDKGMIFPKSESSCDQYESSVLLSNKLVQMDGDNTLLAVCESVRLVTYYLTGYDSDTKDVDDVSKSEQFLSIFGPVCLEFPRLNSSFPTSKMNENENIENQIELFKTGLKNLSTKIINIEGSKESIYHKVEKKFKNVPQMSIFSTFNMSSFRVKSIADLKTPFCCEFHKHDIPMYLSYFEWRFRDENFLYHSSHAYQESKTLHTRDSIYSISILDIIAFYDLLPPMFEIRWAFLKNQIFTKPIVLSKFLSTIYHEDFKGSILYNKIEHFLSQIMSEFSISPELGTHHIDFDNHPYASAILPGLFLLNTGLYSGHSPWREKFEESDDSEDSSESKSPRSLKSIKQMSEGRGGLVSVDSEGEDAFFEATEVIRLFNFDMSLLDETNINDRKMIEVDYTEYLARNKAELRCLYILSSFFEKIRKDFSIGHFEITTPENLLTGIREEEVGVVKFNYIMQEILDPKLKNFMKLLYNAKCTNALNIEIDTSYDLSKLVDQKLEKLHQRIFVPMIEKLQKSVLKEIQKIQNDLKVEKMEWSETLEKFKNLEVGEKSIFALIKSLIDDRNDEAYSSIFNEVLSLRRYDYDLLHDTNFWENQSFLIDQIYQSLLQPYYYISMTEVHAWENEKKESLALFKLKLEKDNVPEDEAKQRFTEREELMTEELKNPPTFSKKKRSLQSLLSPIALLCRPINLSLLLTRHFDEVYDLLKMIRLIVSTNGNSFVENKSTVTEVLKLDKLQGAMSIAKYIDLKIDPSLYECLIHFESMVVYYAYFTESMKKLDLTTPIVITTWTEEESSDHYMLSLKRDLDLSLIRHKIDTDDLTLFPNKSLDTNRERDNPISFIPFTKRYALEAERMTFLFQDLTSSLEAKLNMQPLGHYLHKEVSERHNFQFRHWSRSGSLSVIPSLNLHNANYRIFDNLNHRSLSLSKFNGSTMTINAPNQSVFQFPSVSLSPLLRIVEKWHELLNGVTIAPRLVSRESQLGDVDSDKKDSTDEIDDALSANKWMDDVDGVLYMRNYAKFTTLIDNGGFTQLLSIITRVSESARNFLLAIQSSRETFHSAKSIENENVQRYFQQHIGKFVNVILTKKILGSLLIKTLEFIDEGYSALISEMRPRISRKNEVTAVDPQLIYAKMVNDESEEPKPFLEYAFRIYNVRVFNWLKNFFKQSHDLLHIAKTYSNLGINSIIPKVERLLDVYQQRFTISYTTYNFEVDLGSFHSLYLLQNQTPIIYKELVDRIDTPFLRVNKFLRDRQLYFNDFDAQNFVLKFADDQFANFLFLYVEYKYILSPNVLSAKIKDEIMSVLLFPTAHPRIWSKIKDVCGIGENIRLIHSLISGRQVNRAFLYTILRTKRHYKKNTLQTISDFFKGTKYKTSDDLTKSRNMMKTAASDANLSLFLHKHLRFLSQSMGRGCINLFQFVTKSSLISPLSVKRNHNTLSFKINRFRDQFVFDKLKFREGFMLTFGQRLSEISESIGKTNKWPHHFENNEPSDSGGVSIGMNHGLMEELVFGARYIREPLEYKIKKTKDLPSTIDKFSSGLYSLDFFEDIDTSSAGLEKIVDIFNDDELYINSDLKFSFLLQRIVEHSRNVQIDKILLNQLSRVFDQKIYRQTLVLLKEIEDQVVHDDSDNYIDYISGHVDAMDLMANLETRTGLTIDRFRQAQSEIAIEHLADVLDDIVLSSKNNIFIEFNALEFDLEKDVSFPLIHHLLRSICLSLVCNPIHVRDDVYVRIMRFIRFTEGYNESILLKDSWKSPTDSYADISKNPRHRQSLEGYFLSRRWDLDYFVRFKRESVTDWPDRIISDLSAVSSGMSTVFNTMAHLTKSSKRLLNGLLVLPRGAPIFRFVSAVRRDLQYYQQFRTEVLENHLDKLNDPIGIFLSRHYFFKNEAGTFHYKSTKERREDREKEKALRSQYKGQIVQKLWFDPLIPPFNFPSIGSYLQIAAVSHELLISQLSRGIVQVEIGGECQFQDFRKLADFDEDDEMMGMQLIEAPCFTEKETHDKVTIRDFNIDFMLSFGSSPQFNTYEGKWSARLTQAPLYDEMTREEKEEGHDDFTKFGNLSRTLSRIIPLRVSSADRTLLSRLFFMCRSKLGERPKAGELNELIGKLQKMEINSHVDLVKLCFMDRRDKILSRKNIQSYILGLDENYNVPIAHLKNKSDIFSYSESTAPYDTQFKWLHEVVKEKGLEKGILQSSSQSILIEPSERGIANLLSNLSNYSDILTESLENEKNVKQKLANFREQMSSKQGIKKLLGDFKSFVGMKKGDEDIEIVSKSVSSSTAALIDLLEEIWDKGYNEQLIGPEIKRQLFAISKLWTTGILIDNVTRASRLMPSFVETIQVLINVLGVKLPDVLKRELVFMVTEFKNMRL